jgi:Tfp pilus assembly protein PilF
MRGMLTFRILIYIFCALFIYPTASIAAEKPWTEVRSPHFRVLTNGSSDDARRVAHEFEQLRYVFATLFPTFRLDSGAPLLVLAARDEDTAKNLEPRLWKMKGAKPAGVFHHGWEKQFAMVRLDTWSQGAREVVYHEYTHSILHMNAHWLPVWLDEGIAEFYAYTRFDEHHIYVGAPTERYRVMATAVPIPIETLITVNQRSPYYHDDDKVQMFYAESWALVHYLTFGPNMDGGKRMDQFFALMQKGMDQKKAFTQVFGDFAPMDKALQAYMTKFTFTSDILASPTDIDPKSFESRPLTMADTEAELGSFHLWTHNLDVARPLVEQALKDDPKLGLAHEEMGFLLFAEGKDAQAMDEFSRAYALDGTLYLSLFAKTMLSTKPLSDVPADQNALHDDLLKILALNPQFAPAYIQLAELSLRQGDPKTAFGLSRKAEQLEPWRAGYHLLTGQIMLRMGDGATAAASAQYVAERWFGSDHNEAVELWDDVPANQRPLGAILVQEAPKDTQEAIGTLKSLTCDAQAATWSFVVNHKGQDITYRGKGGGIPVGGFADTLWYGEDHFNSCHHLEGLRVVVHFRPPSDGSDAGDVVLIEVRDDLPSPRNVAD